METRKVLLYVLALLFLTFALGSLSRVQNNGSILYNSYWLLYLLDLVPVIALALFALLIVIIAYYWRSISGAIGFGLSRRRQMGRRRSKRAYTISIIVWILAITVLALRWNGHWFGGGTTTPLYNAISGSNSTMTSSGVVTGLHSQLAILSSFLLGDWFSILLGALLIVCGAILVESYRISLKETESTETPFLPNQTEALHAVGQALTLIHDAALDPRARIIACYERLISAASRLGAQVSKDQTARELETSLRNMFMLRGEAIHGLTGLFEEARYSLHSITEEDVSTATDYLDKISIELNIQLDNQP